MIVLKYIASSGNVYDLKSKEIKTKTANYHTWAWKPVGVELKYGLRITDFTKDAAEYSTTLIFEGSCFDRKDLLDTLHEDFEYDIRNKTPGRIIWGECYIDCYITESNTEPTDKLSWTENEINIYAPYPFWIREEKKSFTASSAPLFAQFLDFEFDFDYDYTPPTAGSSLWVRDFPFASEFQMVVYGPVASPHILINGHVYEFYETLLAGEYAIIDSRKNTITKVTTSGQEINIFDKRNKNASIFENIPGGTLTVNWSGAFGFDLIIFEERSEPHSGDDRYAGLTGNGAQLYVER